MYFARNRKCAAELRAQERKKPSRIISLLLVISMLCGNFVGLPTVASEVVAYCGLEEHTHSDACYQAVQVAGETTPKTLAADAAAETTAPTEAALVLSGGSDAQALDGAYVEKEQCCGKEEHKHSLACYSNPEADLETAAIWEATLPEKLSGDWGKDLAEVAKSQLGYAESAANYLVGADGETLMGYSRYGAWYSDYTQDAAQAYADWNVPFLFFCLYYAGVEDFPIEENCADWTASLAAAELWRDVAGEYIPEAGDLVFLDTDEDGAADRAAVVTEWDEAKVTAVESDSEGAVKSVTYDLTEDTQVLGYGATNEAQEEIEVSDGEDAPVLWGTLTANYDYFYLDTTNSSAWRDSNQEIRLWYWNGSNNGKYSDKFTLYSGNVYRLKVPESMDVNDSAFVLCRFNSTDTVSTGHASWKAPVGRVNNNITVNSSYNTYVLNSDGTSGNWSTTWTGEDLSSGSSGGGDTPTGARRVYFDATLSKLDYTGTTTNYSIPSTGGTIRYYATGSGVSDKEGDMTKASNYTSGSNTWSDVYYVDLPAGYSYIAFSAFDMTSITNYGGHGESTTKLEIPPNITNPCFYADTSDRVVYDGGTRDGYWGEVYTIRDAEDGKNTDVVDITQATFKQVANTFYVNTTFFDYYTDYELNGSNRDSYNIANGASHRNWITFRQLNQALSESYKSKSVGYPVYVGHFQPTISGWGYQFTGDVSNSLNLYGYTYNNSTNRFFAANNANIDEGGTSGKTSYAMQGLVYNQLSSGGDLMAYGGTLKFPLFDADFINGANSKNTKLGEVYENVAFPFTKEDVNNNGVEYWVFDSEDTTLAMQQDPSTKAYYLKNIGNNERSRNVNETSDPAGKTYGFFPFNATSSTTHANTYNYGFGTRIDLTFRLTEEGTVLDKNKNPVNIEFQFSGDDDVWVFIDGKLALDVGGAHGKVTGKIDFGGKSATKSATVYNVKYGGSATTQYSERTTSFTLNGKNTDEHTLTMFYMERGMWESNMKITFNFPDENQLEVEKEVDMENVNEIFKDSFKNQKLFTFNIKNLATHFADVAAKGQSYDLISWDIAGSTLRKDPSNSFSRYTYHGRSNALHWYAQYDDGSSQYRHKRYGVLSLPDTIDITNMAKLSFDVYVEDVNSFSLSNMYLQILDADVEVADLVDNYLAAGNDNAMGCISSSLSGKTYGTPSTQGGTWVTITLDLSKLDEADGFDKTRVMHLRFGYNYPNNIYLSNITFLPAAQQKNPTGFITQQYDVPSYGSATSGELEPAAGAVYTSSVNTNARASYVVDGNGNFALQHGETVNFHDQFRRGSYIYLEEVLNAQERVLYSTKWSMYENDVAVSSKEDGNTINIVSNNGMIDVGTKFVSDGRTELVTNGTTAGHAEKNAYDEADRPANSFVFRSYANPDSTATTTKLKVKFTNTVNVGSLTITKKKVEGTTNLSGSFGFRVRFYNVGGIGLESEDIVLTFSLGQDESKTITGIPLNTQYSIYEIKPTESSHITLDHVTRADSTTSNPAGYVDTTYTTVSGSSSYTSKAYRVDGTISASDEYSVIFYNIYKPVVSLALRKLWRDGQNNDIANPPASITVQLQRSKNGTTWYSVTDRNIEPGYVGWKNLVYTFEDLDKYVDYPNDQTVWQYRVLEKNGANVVAHNTSITIDGVEFVVTYSSENGAAAQDQNGNWSQTITNTQDSNVSLVVKKNWTYANGTTPVTDYTQVPTAVYIQLYKQVGTEKEQYVGDYTLNPSADGKTWADYSLTISDLPKTDANGNVYKYFVREKKAQNQGPVAEGGTFTDNKGNEFTVSYSDVTEVDDKTFEQTITNKYSPKTEVTVTKKWTADNAGTTYTGKDIIPSSIWVGLQRKVADTVWSDNVEVLQKMQLTSTGNWTGKFENLDAVTDAGQAYEYRVVELTGENGTVVTSGNPIEYDGTTFKVTYSTTTDSETGAFTTTITNQVKYTASIAITKQASDTKQNLSGVTFKLEKWDSTYTTKDPNFDAQTDTTDGNGAASFSDLKSGCYLLTETQTKAGYNLLASPIKVEVKDTAEGKLEVYVNGTKQNIDPKNGVYTYSTTIYNKPKLDMPATGGVGGFEFWILGGLLIMAVPLLMYTFIWYRKGGKYLQR